MLLESSIITNDLDILNDDKFDNIINEIKESDMEDPDDIAKPWDEKYGDIDK